MGVPSSQALPGFLITAPPSVCIIAPLCVRSAVVVSLAVWIQNPKKKVGCQCRQPNLHLPNPTKRWGFRVNHEGNELFDSKSREDSTKHVWQQVCDSFLEIVYTY